LAFIELNDVLFRGELRGARGTARFKLTARALNAVDTLNIAGNQVTYSTYQRWYGGPITYGVRMFGYYVEVPDTNVFVEIVAYGHNAANVAVNGVIRPNRNRRSPGYPCLPFVDVLHLPKGGHYIEMTAAISGYSNGGYILCRYIRRTGASNL